MPKDEPTAAETLHDWPSDLPPERNDGRALAGIDPASLTMSLVLKAMPIPINLQPRNCSTGYRLNRQANGACWSCTNVRGQQASPLFLRCRMNAFQRARQIWSLLSLAARNRQVLTYDIVGRLIGMPRQGL